MPSLPRPRRPAPRSAGPAQPPSGAGTRASSSIPTAIRGRSRTIRAGCCRTTAPSPSTSTLPGALNRAQPTEGETGLKPSLSRPDVLGVVSQAIDHTGGRHFSGTMTRILVEYLRDTAPPGSLEQVLREAGETR